MSELEKAIREVLDEALDIEVMFTTNFTRSKLDPRKQQAADHLIDLGFLQMSGLLGRGYVTSDMLRATAHGREYWEKLTSPRWYWFRYNWLLSLCQSEHQPFLDLVVFLVHLFIPLFPSAARPARPALDR